jgi:phosphotransferase family enzyme
VPDLKLTQIIEAIGPKDIRKALVPFFGDEAEIRIQSTRVEPPDNYWVVYEAGDRKAVLKCFFSESEYKRYVPWIESEFPSRVDRPDHPGGGMILLPELNAVVWAYPFDPSMPGLPDCVDPDWIAGVLGRKRGKPVQANTVVYRPEISALLSYRTEGGRRIAFGKVAPEAACGLIYVAMNRLWNSDARAGGKLRVAKPLAFRPDHGLLLQSPVPGKPLDGHRNRLLYFELAEYAAGALGALQSTNTPFGEERPLDYMLHRIETQVEESKYLAPRLHPMLRDLGHQMRERAKSLRPADLVPSHGDYKWDQFLESRGQFSLIDFEFFCQAEPEYDAGYFAAYLPPSRPEDWREGAAGELARNAFLRAYAASVDREVSWARLGLYEAGMLAVRGFSYVGSQRPGWELMASQLISLAFERLVNPVPAAAEAPKIYQ